MSYLTVLVLVACAVAVVLDLRARRIPNWLTLGLAAVSLASQSLNGPVAIAQALAIYVAVMTLGCVVFSVGWLGGGDVKLLAAAAAAFGWPDSIALLVYTALGGGILAVAIAAAQGRLVSTVSRAFAAIPLFPGWRPAPAGAPNRTMLPYGCAIAFGAAAVALSDSVAPFLRLSP
jgi:prepilin peptidase CpaA